MRKITLFLIEVYRKISFFFPSCCIYIPSCSEYAKQAFLNYSFLKASFLCFRRILRCHPFSCGGYDPLK